MKMGDLAPLHAVVFRVGGLVCALPSGTVREVLPSVSATRIPGASAGVAGLVNVRGRMVTAVDAHAVLGQPVPDAPALLLVDRAGAPAGLKVGEVLDFLEVPGALSRGREAPAGLQVGEVLDFLEVPGALSRGREAPAGVDPRLVRGSASWNGQRMLLLDIDALLSPFLGG
jgi:chemotaxis signal transduction protein